VEVRPGARAAALLRTASSPGFVWRHLLPLGLVVLFFVSLRLTGAPIADIDAYYHIKMSEMIRTHGILRSFPWLQYTILNQPYVDMHFLYHLINLPLTFFDLETAAKIAGALWAIGAFVMFHILIARLRVPYAGLWTLALLAVSWNFLFRMNISRAPSASVLFQFLALLAFYEKRWRMLAGVAFAFVWLYQFYIILLPMAGMFMILEYVYTRRLEWRYLAYSAAGILAGLIINPYFPHDFEFFYKHVIQTGGNTAGIPQGKEWLPFDSNYFVTCCWGAFGTLGVVLLLAIATGARVTWHTVVAVLICGMYFGGYARSRRFAEYFVPFTMFASALIWRDTVASGGFRTWPARVTRFAIPAVCAAIAIGAVVDWNKSLVELRRHITPTRYRAASQYIAQHSQAGDIVFSADWDDFPELFFHNTKNYYIVGLDPNLLYLANKDKYVTYTGVASGQVARPSRPLADQFRAKYALSDYMHPQFIAQASRDPGLALCFQDSNTLVWRVDPGIREQDRIEAEELTPPAAAQPATLKWQIQNFKQQFGGPASKDRTIFVQTANPAEYAEFAVPAKSAGDYDVSIGYVKAADMGVVQWSCNGKPCGDPADGYNVVPRSSGLLDLGRLRLQQGANRFRATVTGANQFSHGKRFAVDYFQLKPVEPQTSGTALTATAG
jgi:hypothetical protein